MGSISLWQNELKESGLALSTDWSYCYQAYSLEPVDTLPYLVLRSLLTDREVFLDEGERDVSHFLPSVVNDQRMSAIGHLVELGDRGIVLLQLVLSFDDRHGDRMVFLACDEQEGPRAGFFVLTRSSVHGLRLAAAPWKTKAPDPGTAYCS